MSITFWAFIVVGFCLLLVGLYFGVYKPATKTWVNALSGFDTNVLPKRGSRIYGKASINGRIFRLTTGVNESGIILHNELAAEIESALIPWGSIIGADVYETEGYANVTYSRQEKELKITLPWEPSFAVIMQSNLEAQ